MKITAYARKRGTALALGLSLFAGTVCSAPTNPILFVTQFPIANDFATVGAVFANHLAHPAVAGRGGDLYIRYPDGSLRNLTREAGFGSDQVFQGANSISVRDPAVHWSGSKAVFSMAIGAPTSMFQVTTHYWQLYEVTGLGVGQTAVITKVPNQPTNNNNVQANYLSNSELVFVSDRAREGAAHLYPVQDEYETTATPSGLWRLNPSTGALMQLQHSPSGSFKPFVDQSGRLLFTRWDHLQRDQQAEVASNGAFNYSGEGPTSVPTASATEVFPEPRISVPGSGVEGFTINHFFPWQIQQDGTGEETLNHLGRHELHSYFNRSLNTDNNLREFIGEISGRVNPRPILNVLHLREDPNVLGRYIAIDAPEFNTHAAGQVIRFNAAPNINPAQISIDYLTHRDTFGTVPSANHSGHYRDPVVLSNGEIWLAHAAEQGLNGNAGTRPNPIPRYQFRIKQLSGTVGTMSAGSNLLSGSGIVRQIEYFDPDVRVSYNGPMWEMSPVEVIARSAPPTSSFSLPAPEQAAFTQTGVALADFRAWMAQRQLALFTVRNTTLRDRLDRQQPFNLRVPGGTSAIANTGTAYDVQYMQMFQGDFIRGLSGLPRPGRRVLAQVLHDPAALAANLPPTAGAPAGSVRIAADGSVAVFVPANRVMSWHITAPDGTPVVRERYWITAQPGEVRACDGCHGVNEQSQLGQAAAVNTPQALIDLLERWRGDTVFANGFEG